MPELTPFGFVCLTLLFSAYLSYELTKEEEEEEMDLRSRAIAAKHRYGERRGEDIIRKAVCPHHQGVIDSFKKEGCLHPKFWTEITRNDLAETFGVHRLVVAPLWKSIKNQQQVLFLSLSSHSHLLLRNA